MKYEQGRAVEALRRVQVFLDRHGEALAAINNSGARKRVDAAAADLEAYAVQKDGAGACKRGEVTDR